jgi:iron complex outermembrane receptor protein
LNVTKGVDGDDAARNTSGQGRVNIRVTPNANLSARFYASDASVMLNESPQTVGEIPPVGVIEAVPLSAEELERYESGTPVEDLDLDGANFIPSANDPDNDQDSDFLSMLVSFEQRPRERFGYSIRYHSLSTHRALADGPLGVTFFEPIASSLSEFDGRIHTLNARADIEGGSHHFVTAGYELENESLLSRAADGFTDSSVDVSQRSHTFIVQDQVRLMAGALQLSGAFRTQLFDLEEPTFAPAEGSPYQGIELESPENAYTGDGSVAYFIRDSGTKVRAHLGNGYRAPSLYERFGAFFSSFGYSNFGDPRLQPESSIAFDAGVDQDFANQRARVSATYFYTRLKQIIIFDFSGAINPATDPFGRFGGYRRVNGGRAQGFELSATAATGGLRLGASYTFTDAEPPTEGFEELVQAYGVPKHQFTIVATQRIGKNFYVNVDLALSNSYMAPVFDTATFTSRSYRFDGIRKADVGASYTWELSGDGNLRLFAKVDNLFDQDYYENGFRTVRRIGYGGVAFEF